MSIQTMDAGLLKQAFLAAARNLENNKDWINELNVFPVPDGDTGTNMTLTILSAVKEVEKVEEVNIANLAKAISSGSLRGARGNSGVITSQLFRGFYKALKGVDKITPTQFADAITKGAEVAYKAVMKPKEGTILTVARVVAENAVQQARNDPDDYDALFDVILSRGEEILKKTPDMLPALKQAGVVDSGGQGLLLILRGCAAVLRNEDLDSILGCIEENNTHEEDLWHDLSRELTYTYCVQFSVRHFRNDVDEHDLDSFRRRLNRIGDCVQVRGDLAETSVHIHTDNPGSALEFGVELGELSDIRIDNLAAMKRELEGESDPTEAPPESDELVDAEPEKAYGMVTVSMGDGFKDFFQDLNVDQVVEGGQTMNPSVDDLLHAISRVPAEHVFVLPNNGNVVFAANQAAKMSQKDVRVIPTKNMAMGIAAAIAFQQDQTPDGNEQQMAEAAEHVKTATITYAIRDSEYEGVSMKQGDIIGMHNGKIETSGSSVREVALDIMPSIVDEDSELITVYYGADITEEEAAALTKDLEEAYDFCDVEYHCGGQPLYYYIIAVE